MNTRENVDEILARAGIFQGSRTNRCISADQAAAACRFPRGHTVFAEASPAIGCHHHLRQGEDRPAVAGRPENLLTIMGPSDMFVSCRSSTRPRTSSATTITEVRAVSMDREALRAWIADRPEIAEQLLRVLARRLRRTTTTWPTSSSPTCRAGGQQLLQLAQRFGTQEVARCGSPTI